MKLVYSRRALADLNEITSYYAASASPAIAERVARAPYGSLVMRGLDPRIHQTIKMALRAMDCRVKPGHDDAVS